MKSGLVSASAVLALSTLFLGSASGFQRSSSRTIPADTVIRAELDDQLSTRNNKQGDVFTATLTSRDFSGLPEGTRFQGVVTQARRPTKRDPAVLDVRFQRAILPGGSTVAVDGQLFSLDKDNVVETRNGRLQSKPGKKKFDVKWVAYGAGAGAILGTVFGGKAGRGALLGGLGGAAYAYLNKGKGKDHGDVQLSAGDEFGIRLSRQMVFTNKTNYRYAKYDSQVGRDR